MSDEPEAVEHGSYAEHLMYQAQLLRSRADEIERLAEQAHSGEVSRKEVYSAIEDMEAVRLLAPPDDEYTSPGSTHSIEWLGPSEDLEFKRASEARDDE